MHCDEYAYLQGRTKVGGWSWMAMRFDSWIVERCALRGEAGSGGELSVVGG